MAEIHQLHQRMEQQRLAKMLGQMMGGGDG